MMDKGGIVKTINGLLMKDTRTDEMDKGGIVKTISGLLVEDTRADDEAWSRMIVFGIKCRSS